jgi:DNA mismatch repair protein MutL
MLQLFSTYIVVTDDEGLLLVDQHAAHERVMYEKMLGAFDRGAAQQLLHPVVIDLTAAQGEVLGELTEALAGYGIWVELFGNRSFRITALPAGLSEETGESFILQLLDGLRKDAIPAERPGWLRERAARAACHAAVRASQKMGPTQAQALLRDLFECANPGHCPHGRPTYIRLDRREIEKRFRRIP